MEINQIFEEKDYKEAFDFIMKSETPLTIREISSSEEGKRFFQIVEIKTTQADLDTEELARLIDWFDTYYAQHEQKYRRLRTLNKSTDDGRNPYDCLIELYNEAEKNRKRIQELGG